MSAATLLTTTLLSAAAVGSQLRFSSPELVTQVSAVDSIQTHAMVEPIRFVDEVPAAAVESATVALKTDEPDFRAIVILNQQSPQLTSLEVVTYGSAKYHSVSPQLWHSTCENSGVVFKQQLAPFSEDHSSLTDLPSSLTSLLSSEQAYSVAVVDQQTQEMVACQQL